LVVVEAPDPYSIPLLLFPRGRPAGKEGAEIEDDMENDPLCLLRPLLLLSLVLSKSLSLELSLARGCV